MSVTIRKERIEIEGVKIECKTTNSLPREVKFEDLSKKWASILKPLKLKTLDAWLFAEYDT